MAQAGVDKLMELTDSRYRLSMIAARRAAQIKNGIPTLLTHEESPKTRNTVSIALKEMVLDKGVRWGDDLPSQEELKQAVDRDRRLDNSYSVSYDRKEESGPSNP